ncbi:MAG: ATP-dependent DNA helicase RecG [Bacteroidetes bacterium]|nr:ATP-dependent DNA helicase RecG [Bacteroidota bacterium]MCH8940995.1 ATP-dependent DNA helicase RecG [Bacteroidota bacterium]
MNSINENILNQSVQYVKAVGPKRAESFESIGIKTIRDLLFYFPSKHLDRSTTLTIGKAYSYLVDGYEGEITIIAEVVKKGKRRYGKKEMIKVSLKDSTGLFECVWFQGVKYIYDIFQEGKTYAVSGKPTRSKYGDMQLIHPDYDRISQDETNEYLNTGKIIPFYRIPKTIKNKNLGDFSLRRILNNAVEKYADLLQETLPENIVQGNDLLKINEAVKNIHFPLGKESYNKALKRFKFEEIFYLEILIALRKYQYKSTFPGIAMNINNNLLKNFLDFLPYKLTDDQQNTLRDIFADMKMAQPMNRLIQGDVGSGKTIVSLIAMIIAADNGYQSVLMAPTEILADQHYKNISKMLNDFANKNNFDPIQVSLLIGGQNKKDRTKVLKKIETGESKIIIGTHALFEEKVSFNNLGLIIVDEQHRFGVEQRGKLLKKGKVPDVIVMSATPIPRTLTMTVYADLDVSLIKELPRGRKKIKTVLRRGSNLPDIYNYIVNKAKEGIQSFIVYPLVEDSEKLELKSAETYYNNLTNTFFNDINVGLLHGRMSWQEKENIMLQFKAHKFNVLISTTVIEVGIDIPNANIILINDAHRFGLSQLHQLRGRVGRSEKQAYCILVTDDKNIKYNLKKDISIEYLSTVQLNMYKSSIRLNSMVKYSDGFKLAEIDLKLRGPGDIFGTKQSGLPDLVFIDIVNDTDIIEDAKYIAFKLIKDDIKLEKEKNNLIRQQLKNNYSSHFFYSKIA